MNPSTINGCSGLKNYNDIFDFMKKKGFPLESKVPYKGRD